MLTNDSTQTGEKTLRHLLAWGYSVAGEKRRHRSWDIERFSEEETPLSTFYPPFFLTCGAGLS